MSFAENLIIARIMIFAAALCLTLIEDSFAQSQQPSPRPGETTQPQNSEAARPQTPAAGDQRGTKQSPFIVELLPTPKTGVETDQDDAKDREEKSGLRMIGNSLSTRKTLMLLLLFWSLSSSFNLWFSDGKVFS
jgi:hypothetical protein